MSPSDHRCAGSLIPRTVEWAPPCIDCMRRRPAPDLTGKAVWLAAPVRFDGGEWVCDEQLRLRPVEA